MTDQFPALTGLAASRKSERPSGIYAVCSALTFAMREALFALEAIEKVVVSPSHCSDLKATLEKTMRENPASWVSHYHGTEEQLEMLRAYSFSDRCRYYWHYPEVEAAVGKLMHNLEETVVPQPLLSQFLHEDFISREEGLRFNARRAVINAVQRALKPYSDACFTHIPARV